MVNRTYEPIVRKPQHTMHYNNVSPMMFSIIDDPISPVRFLILDCPTESTLGFYIEQFINLNVRTVVRCCPPTYSTTRLSEYDINVVDLPFKDGGVPSPTLVRDWNLLIDNIQQDILHHPSSSCSINKTTIAVHCVAGLGRAPVLVAIALIEAGMDALDSIENIRSKRRGAFNKPQIAFLDSYKRTTRHKPNNFTWRLSLGKMFRMTA